MNVARMLVVDDEPAIGEAVRLALEGLRGRHVELTTESSAEDALAILQSSPFDIVVSDYQMPRHDGIELLRAARATHPSGYRILMTGYGEIERPLEDIRAAGIDAYIPKPIRIQPLRLALRDFIEEIPSGIAEHRAHARAIEGAIEI